MRLVCFVLAVLMPACGDDLDDRVQQRYGSKCHVARTCGDLAYVDCGAAADGPAYYYNSATDTEISQCGGFCWMPDPAQQQVCATMCPPPSWTCAR